MRAEAVAEETVPLESVEILKKAAKTKSVKSSEVFKALRALEKASLQDASWPAIVGGDRSPGHRWGSLPYLAPSLFFCPLLLVPYPYLYLHTPIFTSLSSHPYLPLTHSITHSVVTPTDFFCRARLHDWHKAGP